MKNLTSTCQFRSVLLALAFVFAGQLAYTQVYISTNKTEFCTYNERTEKFDNCKDWEENTMFEVNAEETMFTHTTNDISSAYYVKDKSEEDGMILWTVVSDVGNKYVYVFDFENEMVSVVGNSDDAGQFMKTYFIKRAWTDD